MIKRTITNLLGIQRQLAGDSAAQVQLTFDDGPHPQSTGMVLDRLDKYDVSAIFFIVGSRIKLAPHMLQEIADRGHILGNHTDAHWLESPPGYRQYLADITLCQQRIFDLTGITPMLFRPALGQITFSSLAVARKLSLEYMLWSLDSNDWRITDQNTARETGNSLASQVVARDIILMHDNKPHTPQLLDTFLPGLQQGGYTLSSLSKQPRLPGKPPT